VKKSAPIMKVRMLKPAYLSVLKGRV